MYTSTIIIKLLFVLTKQTHNKFMDLTDACLQLLTHYFDLN